MKAELISQYISPDGFVFWPGVIGEVIFDDDSVLVAFKPDGYTGHFFYVYKNEVNMIKEKGDNDGDSGSIGDGNAS